MTTLILSRNVVRAALFFHVHAFRSSGYWSAVWSPKMSRFMVTDEKVYKNYLKVGTICVMIPVKAERSHGETRVTAIGIVPVSNEGTELRTKVLVFVLVVESSVEEQVDIAARSYPRYWRRKFGNDRSWGIGRTIYL
jgi:hypothetical protein